MFVTYHPGKYNQGSTNFRTEFGVLHLSKPKKTQRQIDKQKKN